jgi:type III restriction enzyme
MALRLKDYQTRCLESLSTYLGAAGSDGAKRAFVIQTERPYRSVPQLPELPYVCIRVPTGGGKTIMAAHAVGIASNRYLQRDQALCLWLVPSNAILEQTLLHLRTPGDPYREALTSHFQGPVSVLTLAEALYLQRSVLDGETVVIVSTLAALRVEDTEGRKVYEQSGALEHHFTDLDPLAVQGLECRDDGRPVESLANVLHLRHPIVIMDEAHTARTPLSFDTLARLSPSCVIEFTATPSMRHAPESGFFASNILAHVSAAELKAEDMIKLPIRLYTRPLWTDAVTEALAMRGELEVEAGREAALTGESIRPIILFQAEANRQHGEPVTVEVLERALTDDHAIPPEQIAISTGNRRELDGVDLNAPGCSIRYVITVQALREGWDCPWAYVVCSVANQASPRAVEQILGRVLRLPGALPKSHEALNRSYAYVVSPSFASAAQGLKDALVENGFERLEAEVLVEDGGDLPGLFAARPHAPVSRVVYEKPDLGVLRGRVRASVTFDEASYALSSTLPIDDDTAERLAGTVASAEAKAAIRRFARETREGPDAVAAEPPRVVTPLQIPLLAIRSGDTLELFEESCFLDRPWRIADAEPVLSDEEYSSRIVAGAAGQVDVSDAGRLEVTFRDQVASQLALLDGEPGWTVPKLSVWLDRHIPHPDLTQQDVSLFIHRVLESLIESRGLDVTQLAHDKYRLRRAIEARIEQYRSSQHREAYQELLFGAGADRVVVSPDLTVTLGDRGIYAPNWLYEGAYTFRKHVHPLVGELKSDGEEHDCAVHLDEHPRVECWLRNLERRPRDSFWLQTSTDRF